MKGLSLDLFSQINYFNNVFLYSRVMLAILSVCSLLCSHTAALSHSKHRTSEGDEVAHEDSNRESSQKYVRLSIWILTFILSFSLRELFIFIL